MAEKKQSEEKPFFTPALLVLLVVACGLTAGVTYYFVKPAPPHDPHGGNPNVKKLAKVPKTWQKTGEKGYQFTASQKYWRDNVLSKLKKLQPPIRNCYFGYKGKFRVKPKGYRVVLQVSVEKSGKIKKVEFVKARTDFSLPPKILACVHKQVSGWTFSPHNFKKPYVERIPFFFR